MKDASIGIIFFAEKVLLIERRDVPVWVLPGGGIEQDELPEVAVVREVKEETGLDVAVVRKVGLWLPINKIGAPAHVFECKADVLPNTLAPCDESRAVRFWPIAELPKQLFFLHREWIEAALEKAAKPTLAMMINLTYWNCFKLLLSHPILAFRYLLSRLGLPINNG